MSMLIQLLFSTLLLLFGAFGALSSGNASAQDIERKADIDALQQALEQHRTREGEYPTAQEFARENESQLPGLEQSALIDPDGDNMLDTEGDYLYIPSDCSAVGCKHYELRAILELGSDYIKKSAY